MGDCFNAAVMQGLWQQGLPVVSTSCYNMYARTLRDAIKPLGVGLNTDRGHVDQSLAARILVIEQFANAQLRVIDKQVWTRIVRVAHQLAQIFQRWLLIDQVCPLGRWIIPQTTQIDQQVLMA